MINIRKLEAELWESADLLRAGSKLTSNQYCMPVLGLIFLRYAYSRFKLVEAEIMKDRPTRGGRVLPVEASDYAAKSALFLPREAQYSYLLELPDDITSADIRNINGQKMNSLGEVVNNAMELVEQQSEQLAGVLPKDAAVVPYSVMAADTNTCGTCVIPTEFGGKAVVVQDIHSARPRTTWAGCRRHGTLDALDLAVPGKMPARLLTDGYACMVSVGKTVDGKTAGVFVLNLGTGETPPLELAMRRGATTDWTMARPGQGDVAADVVRQEGDETVVRLPSLPPFGVVLLSVKKGIVSPY